MGNQATQSYLLFSQGTKSGQWTMKNQQGIAFLKNNFSGNQFQLKNKRISYEQLKKYILREKYSFNHTPKLFMFDHSFPNANILVEYASYKIQNVIQIRKRSLIQVLNQLLQLIHTLSYLVNKYGCFYITESMIRFNNSYQPVIWLNQDFSKNQPQFPLPNGEGQQPMITKICKIYQRLCPKTYKIQIKNTFKMTGKSIQKQIQKLRNQKCFQTSTKSSQPELLSKRCYSTVKFNYDQSKFFETNSQLNQTALLNSRSNISNPLNCSGRTIPINQTKSYLVQNLKQKPNLNFQNNQIYYAKHNFTPFNPQQGSNVYLEKYNYQNKVIAATPHPKIPAITFKNSQLQYQRASMDSQYKRIFLNKNNIMHNNPQPVLNTQFLTTSNRSASLSHSSSFQSLRVPGSPIINLKPCMQTPQQDYLLDSPTSFYKKKQTMQYQSTENTHISPRIMTVSSSQKNIQYSEMSPSDFMISQSHLMQDLENDFNGCFGSNKSIKDQSQIGSPLKRQLRTDLQQLFI